MNGWNTLRAVIRRLVRNGVSVYASILVLAIAIGTFVVASNLLRVLLWRGIDAERNGELIQIWANTGWPMAFADFRDIEKSNSDFSSLGVYTLSSVNLGGARSRVAPAVLASAGVLRCFDAHTILGRLLTDADSEIGAAPVAVVSNSFWKNALGGSMTALGTKIRINGMSVEVVGVLAPDFEFMSPWKRAGAAEVWLPLQPDAKRAEDRDDLWLLCIGQLGRGVTIKQAQARITALNTRLASIYPETNSNKNFILRNLNTEMIGDQATRLWISWIWVALVLIVTSANVASMFVARTIHRMPEFGIRYSLGASSRDIAAIIFGESIVIAVLAGIISLPIVSSCSTIVSLYVPLSDFQREALSINIGQIAMAITTGLLCGISIGIPAYIVAIRSQREHLNRYGTHIISPSGRRSALLVPMLVAQIATGFGLAGMTAMLAKSYWNVLSDNKGAAIANSLTGEINLHGERYRTANARNQLIARLKARAEREPGIEKVGFTTKLPLEGGRQITVLVNDEGFDPRVARKPVEVSAVTPEYFATVGIRVLRGRGLYETDSSGEDINIVVNNAFVTHYWKSEDPLGKIIREDCAESGFTARIVGVVDDVRQDGAERDVLPEIYWEMGRDEGRSIFLVFRTSQDDRRFASTLEDLVRAEDPDLAVGRIRSLKNIIDEASKSRKLTFSLGILVTITVLSVLSLGIFGIADFNIARRRREIGLRMALGATKVDILKLIISEWWRLFAFGAIMGFAGTLCSGYFGKSLFYRIDFYDPTVIIGVCSIIVFLGACAIWIPAKRAMQLEPLTALHTPD